MFDFTISDFISIFSATYLLRPNKPQFSIPLISPSENFLADLKIFLSDIRNDFRLFFGSLKLIKIKVRSVFRFVIRFSSGSLETIAMEN